MNRKELYTRITETIINKLKEGTVPWRKSWAAGLPSNYISKRIYNGINFLSLISNDYPSQYYLTFLQCSKRGGRINQGEKGYPVIYFKVNEVEVNKEGRTEIERVPLARVSYVFNLAQTSLYEDKSEKLKLPSCEELLLQIHNKPEIRHNSNRCYYSLKHDYISLPTIESFDDSSLFYSSLFHELGHSTAHPSRLNRDMSTTDMETYSKEELIAELSSSFLMGYCGLENKTIDDSASYINGWLKTFDSNPQILIEAAKEASTAVDYLLPKNVRADQHSPQKVSEVSAA